MIRKSDGKTTFDVRCTFSSKKPFEVGKVYVARELAVPDESSFVLMSLVEHGGVRYDNAILKFESENWKFEKAVDK
jgi:hypothetical protein